MTQEVETKITVLKKGKVERLRKPLSAVVAVGLIFLMVFGRPGWSGMWPMEVMRLVGFLLVFAGVLGRLLCTLYIGGRKNRELYQTGIYSLCRNPLYFFSFLGLTGICFISQSLILTVGACSVFLVLYHRVISREEVRLVEMFPSEFELYRRAVPRFWPRGFVRLPRQVLSVDTGIFLRSMTEVLWFLVAIVLIEGLVYLRTIGVIPVLFEWY